MSYRDKNVTKSVVLIFINELSHVLCSLLPSSWSFPEAALLARGASPGAGALGWVGVGFLILPAPRDHDVGGPRRWAARPATSPNSVLNLGVGGGRPPDPERGRASRGGRALGGWAGEGGRGRAGRPAESAWSRLGPGRGGAVSPRSPRPPVGGALVMHYSSPSRPPPAPPPPPSLSPRGLRAAPRSGSAEPSQYCGSSASDGSGEAGVRSLGGGRRAAAGAGAGRGRRWGRCWVTRPRGGSGGDGVWFRVGQSF